MITSALEKYMFKIKTNYSCQSDGYCYCLADTYMTGNTFGNTTEASAKYSYSILASFSSVVFRTKVAWAKHKCNDQI